MESFNCLDLEKWLREDHTSGGTEAPGDSRVGHWLPRSRVAFWDRPDHIIASKQRGEQPGWASLLCEGYSRKVENLGKDESIRL